MTANALNEVLFMGIEWSRSSATFFIDSSFNSVSFGNESGLFAVDSAGRWLAVSHGFPNLFEASDDSTVKWHSTVIPMGAQSTLYRAYSTVFTGLGSSVYVLDSVLGWKGLNGNNKTLFGMDFFNKSILGTSTGKDLIRSTDSGRTWSANILGALPAGIVHATAAAPTRIYAATNGVYYTGDIGKDWSETNDNILTGTVTSLCADSSGRLYAACSSDLFTSSDQGNSWRQLTVPPVSGITNLRANRAATVAYFSASDTIVFRSEDNGLHWQFASLPDHSAITDFYVSPTSDIFASSASGVYYWPSFGTTFFDASDGLDSIGVTALAADSAGNIYAATNGLGVWEAVGDPSLLGVVEHSANVTNVIVSPNPASMIVRIALPSDDKWSAVAMDALGRECPITYTSIGETLQCDVSKCPPGAYEMIIRSGSNQIVSRFEVIR